MSYRIRDLLVDVLPRQSQALEGAARLAQEDSDPDALLPPNCRPCTNCSNCSSCSSCTGCASAQLCTEGCSKCTGTGTVQCDKPQVTSRQLEELRGALARALGEVAPLTAG